MKRILLIFAVLGLLAGPAAVNGKDFATKLAEVNFTADDLERFAIGTIVDWEGERTQARFNFQIDTLDGSTGSAPEWGIEVYDTPCDARRSSPVYARQAIDDPVYGVRINEFSSPILLAQLNRGSAVLVHDGPTPTFHAIAAGFTGRHELACVNISVDH